MRPSPIPVFSITASLLFPLLTSAISSNRAIDVLRIRRQGHDLTFEKLEHFEVEVKYLPQRLDHFSSRPCPSSGGDSCSTKTFRQRYFYSSRYVHKDDATTDDEDLNTALRGGELGEKRRTYAFLCVGGEGPSLDQSVLVDSAHCSGDMLYSAGKLFEEHGTDVHLFSLEHRYYGDSYPVFQDEDGKDQSPVLSENLVFLSSRQALADLAHFVSTTNSDPDLFPRGDDGVADVKWATFGGSYPGMVAAWSRLKFPHLIHMSVSNSAPVQAELDFRGYNNRVASDLSYTKIGGSDECRRVFEEGHGQVAEMLRSGNSQDKEDVAELFNVCGGADALSDQRNADMFLGDGLLFPPAQSNDPHCAGDLCDIGKLCSRLLAEEENTSSMGAIAAVAAVQSEGENCTEVDWDKTVAYLSSPEAQAGGLRSWLWQTCTEFGFYQTCQVNTTCPYGRGFHGPDADLEICSAAFGVSPEAVRQNVQDSLDYYGGWDMRGVGNILSVNGDVDPWSELALTPERQRIKSRRRPTVWVKGASHHFWTHPVKGTDGAEVQAVRDNIYSQVKAWLGEQDHEALRFREEGIIEAGSSSLQ